MPLSTPRRTVFFAALALLAAGSVSAQPSIAPTWTLDATTAGLGAAAANVDRSVAYNPVSGNLLVATRQTSTRIVRVSPSDGTVGTSLTMTGVTGGTFPLTIVGVSDDGQIFACNLAGAATGAAPFKIYRWADESAVPTTIYSGAVDASTARRYGDSFAVWGSGDDVRIYASGSANPTVAAWTWTTSTSTLSAPTLIPVVAGSARGGIARSAVAGNLWVNGSGTTTREINGTTGAVVREVPGTISTSAFYTVETFSTGGRNYVVAGVKNPELEADLLDVTGTPFVVARLARFGTNANAGATGGIAVNRATGRVFLYGTNIGAAAYDTGSLMTIAGAEGWRMLAAPGTGRTLNDLVGTLWTQGFAGADDASGTPNVLDYDEAAPGNLDQGFVAPSAQTDALPVGEGRFVYVYADDNQTTGPVDRGFPKALLPGGPAAAAPFAFSLTYTNDPAQPASEDGWNLLGNPFQTGLDWDQVTRGAGVSDAVYVYDPALSGGSYRVYSGGVGNLPGGEIARGQGFWVQTTAPGATLVAPAAAQTPGGALYRGALAAAQALRFELREGGTTGAEAFVSTSAAGALGLDALDAYALDPLRDAFLRLATQAPADAARLAIQALPADADAEIRLPLAAEAVGGAPGARALELAWDAATLPEGWSAQLRDTATGQSVSLATAGTLAFEAVAEAARTALAPLAISRADDAATAPRFEIVLAARLVASDGAAPAALALAVGPNPARGAATATFTLAEASEATVRVYDALGREVALAFDGLAPAGLTRAALPAGLAPGVYVVRLEAGEAAQAVRLVVTR